MMELYNFIEQTLTKEKVIEDLKKLGYIYLTDERTVKGRVNMSKAILKDITRFKLVQLNSYKYNGQEYKFSYLNINQAINDIDEPLCDNLENVNKIIHNHLRVGNCYEEIRIDETHGRYPIKYVDWENPYNNDFHIAENFIIQKMDSDEVVTFDIVLFLNGIPFCLIVFNKLELLKAVNMQLLKFIHVFIINPNAAFCFEKTKQSIPISAVDINKLLDPGNILLYIQGTQSLLAADTFISSNAKEANSHFGSNYSIDIH